MHSYYHAYLRILLIQVEFIAPVGVSKKSKRGANRGGGGKDSNFAEVSVRQKNSTLLKRESTMRLMRIKALGRKVEKNEEDLRCFIENPKPIVRKGYDPAMRGMKLTGPARPAIDIEPSDHGCGLRLFECRERCVRDATRSYFLYISKISWSKTNAYSYIEKCNTL